MGIADIARHLGREQRALSDVPTLDATVGSPLRPPGVRCGLWVRNSAWNEFQNRHDYKEFPMHRMHAESRAESVNLVTIECGVLHEFIGF